MEAEAIERQIFGPTQEDGVEDDDNGFALEDLNRAAAEAVTLEDIKRATETYPGAQGVIESLNHSEGRKRDAAALKWKISDVIIYAIDFGQAERVYIPETLRERILKVYHEGDWNMHAGREATLAEITKRYYWKGLPSDVARYVQQCIWCQRARAIVPVRQGKLRPTLHEHDGSVLAMDLVGPLSPTKEGHKYY